MKKLLALLSFALVALSATASIAGSQSTPKRVCGELNDQFVQAMHYHKMAVNAHDKNVASLLIPVGHFTTYVSVDEAFTIAKTRMDLIAQQAKTSQCDKTTDVYAKYAPQASISAQYSFSM
jgi:hypothetical protein